MNELKRAYDYIIGGLLCRVGLHKWHYFTMKNLDTTKMYFRCCTRCEKTECIDFDEYIKKVTKECPDK